MSGIFTQELIIPGPMPGLNEILEARARSPYSYNRMKRDWSEHIALIARAQSFVPISRAFFSLHVREPSARRDPSNFCFGAMKFLEDALQEAGLLAGDGQQHILGYAFSWEVSEVPMIELLAQGYPWAEGKESRESKGKSKFRRGIGRAQGMPTLAGASSGRGEPKASTGFPRGNLLRCKGSPKKRPQ